MKILYLSSVLPKRSETFVYNEVLALSRVGQSVDIASLYPPETGLGDPVLDKLARRAHVVYGRGVFGVVSGALRFFLSHPARSAAVAGLAIRDLVLASDMPWASRPKVLYQCLAALSLARAVAGVERVHVHMAHAAATVGMYAARALGVPFSFTGHAADLFRERCLLAEKLRRASFVACISEWHRSWYQSIVPRPDAEYPVIRCGVNVPDPPGGPHPGPALRIGGLGRLVPKKGFDVLIGAVRNLGLPPGKFEVEIAGDGPDRAKLEQSSAGLPIKFIGPLNHSDVPAWIASLDLFVLPCRVVSDGDRDGIPVVLMESMAAGVCSVSGDLPTIRELIRDGESGALTPPGDVEALAGRLGQLMSDAALRRRLGASGRNRVIEEFSREKNVAKLQAQFELTK